MNVFSELSKMVNGIGFGRRDMPWRVPTELENLDLSRGDFKKSRYYGDFLGTKIVNSVMSVSFVWNVNLVSLVFLVYLVFQQSVSATKGMSPMKCVFRFSLSPGLLVPLSSSLRVS